VTPEERLIAALKAQNRIVFGNTIGVDSNNECTVVSEDGTVRAIAGTPISSGSCVALQADDGQWYAVSARESGTIQKKTIYKRKNKPPSADGTGGPVKILYVKGTEIYIGGDRAEPTSVYTIPEGYALFGPPTINNLGTGLSDWLVNVRLLKSDKLTLVTLSPLGEEMVKDVDVPRVYAGFGVDDPSYPDNQGFLFENLFNFPTLSCFQNGFYTAFELAVKKRVRTDFGFLESAITKYASYWADTTTGVKGALLYSDNQQLDVKSIRFSLRSFEPITGETITVVVSKITLSPEGSVVSTPYSVTYTVVESDNSEQDVVAGLILALSTNSNLFSFGFYSSTTSSPSTIVVRGDYNADDFSLSISSSSPTVTGKKGFLGKMTDNPPSTVVTLSVTGLNSLLEEETRTYTYTVLEGNTPSDVADGIRLAYLVNPFAGIEVTGKGFTYEGFESFLVIVTTGTCSLSGSVEVDLRISLGEPEILNEEVKPLPTKLKMFYSASEFISAGTTLGYFSNSSQQGFIFGTDLEFIVAIGAKRESYLLSIKDSKGIPKGVLVVGNKSNEFPRSRFKNALDRDELGNGKNLLDIFDRYFRPNLVDATLFSIPLKPFTMDDPTDSGTPKRQIPIEKIDVFITNLAANPFGITKETVDITQPTVDFVAVDASAYIA